MAELAVADGLLWGMTTYRSSVEGARGHGMRSGFEGIDRATQAREVRPSARRLGEIARAVRVPAGRRALR